MKTLDQGVLMVPLGSIGTIKFEFINPAAVMLIEDKNLVCLEPCELLEDCLQYHDELLSKGRTNSLYKRIHDAIGVAKCEESADLCRQCKTAFKEKFSKHLVEKYASVVGTKNKFQEEYFRGDELYRHSTCESTFYENYKVLKGAKSNFIEDYINKI